MSYCPIAAHYSTIGGIAQTYPLNTYFGKSLPARYAHSTPKGELVNTSMKSFAADGRCDDVLVDFRKIVNHDSRELSTIRQQSDFIFFRE